MRFRTVDQSHDTERTVPRFVVATSIPRQEIRTYLLSLSHSRSCSLRSRAARAGVSLLFAALTGRSGHGLVRMGRNRTYPLGL